MYYKSIFSKPIFTYFDNAGDGDGDGAPPGDNTPNPETFTKEQLEAKVQEEKTKFQKERSKMVQQLEDIQRTASLNEQQKKELEEQLTALREENMTAEERQKAAIEREKKEFSQKITSLQEERDTWQSKFTNSSIRNSLLSAATGNELKPYHPEDIYNALSVDTYLKDIVDEFGKKTGEHEVRVKFRDIDDEGKSVVIDMEPNQAVAKMSKMKRWQHLFQSSKNPGSGGSPSASQEDIDIAELAANNPKKFLELKNSNPEILRKI